VWLGPASPPGLVGAVGLSGGLRFRPPPPRVVVVVVAWSVCFVLSLGSCGRWRQLGRLFWVLGATQFIGKRTPCSGAG